MDPPMIFPNSRKEMDTIFASSPMRFKGIMKWVQRGIALLAILLALYFRNPVKLDYEIFGVALSLTGPTYLFILTGVFIVASAFIQRPWCNYLCPIVPLEDMLRLLHRKQA